MKAENNIVISRQIHSGSNFVTSLGQERQSGDAVIVTHGWLNDHHDPGIEKFHQACNRLRALNSPYFPKILYNEIITGDGTGDIHTKCLMTAYRVPSGTKLSNYLNGQKVLLEDALHIGREVAKALAAIHQEDLLHRSLNPDYIFIDPVNRKIQVTGFGPFNEKCHPFASHFAASDLGDSISSLERQNLINDPARLSYLSPEQARNMNLPVDKRSDLYSLGAVLFELCFGHPPFTGQDPVKLVHCHLTQEPVLPAPCHGNSFKALQYITGKLLQKNPFDRYQKAAGLIKDLYNCLDQLSKSGEIHLCKLNQKERAKPFRFIEKFYGRNLETAKIKAAFNAPDFAGPENVMIFGPAGIGKTSLVMAFSQYIRPFARFVSGKYDQIRQNIPYSALIDALRQLIQSVLTENRSRLDVLKTKMINAMEGNAQLMIDLVPELWHIIGDQPEVPVLDIVETKNRFNFTFVHFIRSLCTPQKRLVLFLDDLQWMDAASVELLERLQVQKIPGLFIIGAFRDDEINPSHILNKYIRTIESAGNPIHRVPIGSLNQEEIVDIISDALSTDETKIHPLAKIVQEQTSGNPFVLKEYLTSLHLRNLLTYDMVCKENRIRELEAFENFNTDHSSDLITKRLLTLEPSVRDVLQQAACLGTEFEMRDLSIICSLPEIEILALLKEAQENDLIFQCPVDDMTRQNGAGLSARYQFVHDWIQLAAFNLIPEAKRAGEHYRIGRALRQGLPQKDFKIKMPDIIVQMNLGRSMIKDQSERDMLAEMNLDLARKAKELAAYHGALGYLETGLQLLGDKPWERCYDLCLQLFLEAMETAFLCVLFERAEALAAEILKHCVAPLDRMKVYEIRIMVCIANNKLIEALDLSRQGLRQTGEHLPQYPGKSHILLNYLKTKYLLTKRSHLELMSLPVMENRTGLAAVRLYAHALSATYFASPLLTPVYIFRMLMLTLKYGKSPITPFIFACYGMILCGVMGDIETGYYFGRTALALVKEKIFLSYSVKTQFIVNIFVLPWKEHPKYGLSSLKNNFQAGLKTGDFEYAAFSIHMYCSHAWYTGAPLVALEDEMRRYNQEIALLKQETALNINRIYRQVVLNLIGKPADPCRLMGESYNEEKMFALHHEAKDRNAFANAYLNKMRLCYLFYEYDQAYDFARMTETFLDAVFGLILIPCFYFYDALVQLAVYPTMNSAGQKKCIKKVRAHQRKLKKWKKFSTVNIEHKYFLIEAEKAKITCDEYAAMKYYELAVTHAKENDYPNEEALACELAGKFFHETGRTPVAEKYFINARNAYQKWGASAKVAHLSENYPQYFTLPNRHISSDVSQVPAEQDMDLATLIKASETISGETVISRLMDKLMTIVLENAGARKGYLILKNGSQWIAEARVSVSSVDHFIPVPMAQVKDLPLGMVRYARRMGQDLVLSNAAEEKNMAAEPYIQSKKLKSALCIPVRHQGEVTGVLYLENNRLEGIFTPERVGVLKTVTKILANVWARNQAQKEVLAYQDQLRSLSSELLLVEEKERRRLAAALHDRVGHALSCAVMKLEKLSKSTSLDQSDEFADIHQLLDQTIEDTHTLTFELSPPVLYDPGLSAALDWLTEQTFKTHQVKVEFFDRGLNLPIEENIRVLMFQSVRELIFNMVKHSQAKEARLTAGMEGNDLWVTLSDAGIGFDPEKINPAGHPNGGFGLFSIQERLSSQGGYMDIDASPGTGTRIRMVLPLEPP